MTDTQTTPTDSPSPKAKTPRKDKGKANPNRARKKRVLGEGEGDVCIYEVAGANSDFPRGSLVPIPEVPRFTDTTRAMRWIRTESADMLTGKQVMVFRAMELLTIQVEAKPTVTIIAKPKVTVAEE